MGINGLLPLLKSIQKPCSLRAFEGKTVGVDAYGWLHRGTVSCAVELATSKPTRKFVDFAMGRVRMLEHFGVIPYLVFDGDYLPSKAATEEDRNKRRENSRKTGLELLKAGKSSQAAAELQKAVDVTPEMARQLIDELKKAKVQYIVAPYEADAQMAYLEKKGIIHAILSEDSDLLVFGAKCLLTKLDQYGQCIAIRQADFASCKEVCLTGWSDKEFRQMAILSGCDYLASINNMGLKTAYRMLRRYKTVEKVIQMLQFDGKFNVPKGYLEAFRQAEDTFLYQRVFCPLTLTLVLHTDPKEPIDETKMPFIGAPVDALTAQGVASGDLNPMTKLPIKPIVVVSTSRFTTPRPAQRIQLAQSSVDYKKGVSIDRFFRPTRFALAEMDVNYFALSSSQENGGSTVPIVLSASEPRPYLNPFDPLNVPHVPGSAPQLVAQTQPFTSSRKRGRLCTENGGTPIQDENFAGASLSRFFTSPADPSPTATRFSRKKRSKNDNVHIFSDDSLEEAMINLPDLDSFAMESTTKVHVFKEQTTAGELNNEVEKIPESPVPDTHSQADSQDSVPSLSSSVSTISSVFASQEAISTPIKESVMTTLKQFSYSAASTKSGTISSTPPQTLQSRIPVAVKSVFTPKSTPTSSSKGGPKTTMTPLQRTGMGASACGNLTISNLMPDTPRPSPVATRGRYVPALPFPEVATFVNTITPLGKFTKPLKHKRADNVTAPCLSDSIPTFLERGSPKPFVGSEDLIVRDSEEEVSEDEELDAEHSAVSHGLNLNRFTYRAV